MKFAGESSLQSLEYSIRIYEVYSMWNEALSDQWFPTDDATSSIGANGALHHSIIKIQQQLGNRLNRRKSIKFILDILGEEWYQLSQKSDIHAVAVIELLGETLMEWADSQLTQPKNN